MRILLAIIASVFLSISGQAQSWQELQIPDMIPTSSMSSPPSLSVMVDDRQVAQLNATAILSNGRFAGWWWSVSGQDGVVVKMSSGENRTVKIFSPGRVSIKEISADQSTP